MTSDEHAAERIRELTNGLGATAVFDFVGVQPTIDLARQVAAINSFIHIVGIGGGILPAGFFSTPFGAAVRAPYWGTRSELIEVLDLARSGAVGVHVEKYDIDLRRRGIPAPPPRRGARPARSSFRKQGALRGVRGAIRALGRAMTAPLHVSRPKPASASRGVASGSGCHPLGVPAGCSPHSEA